MTRKSRPRSTSFSTFVDRYVAELLAGRGWRRSGLAFERRNGSDDSAYLGLQRSSSSRGKVIDFYVNRNVSPKPWREYKTSLMHVAADNWDGQLTLGVF